MKNHLQTENDAALESPFNFCSFRRWVRISKGVQKKKNGVAQGRSRGKSFSKLKA